MTKSSFILILPLFIHFQAAWIIPLGGNLRIFDLLVLLIFAMSIVDRSVFKIAYFILPIFILFIIIPIVGGITGDLLRVLNFYDGFTNTLGVSYLKSRPAVSYITALIFCTVCFAMLATVRLSPKQRDIFAQRYVLATSLISMYSLYAIFFVGQLGFPDLVPDFLDRRNFDPSSGGFRTVGFSNEAGTFALLLMSSLLTISVTPVKRWYFHFVVQAITLALTFSAPALFCSLLLLTFYGFKYISPLRFVVALPFVVYLVYLTVHQIVQDPFLNYMIYQRPMDFIMAIFGYETSDFSGGQRAAALLYGIEVSKYNYFLGVGPGLSPFYFDLVSSEVAITSTIMRPGIFALNMYTHALSEFGIIGFVTLLLFILSYLSYVIRKKKHATHNIGLMVIFGIFGMAISPTYSSILFFPFILRKF